MKVGKQADRKVEKDVKKDRQKDSYTEKRMKEQKDIVNQIIYATVNLHQVLSLPIKCPSASCHQRDVLRNQNESRKTADRKIGKDRKTY